MLFEPAGAEGVLELVEEEGAEAAREDADGQEEARTAGDPAIAAGDDAVQVGMEGQILTPSVQHAEEADLGAEALGVGGDLAQGAGGGAEEDVVEGEDEMEVGAVEQFAVALGDPVGLGGALALGAVAVAAGAVAEAALPAVVALLDLAAEGGGAALLDGGHDAALRARQRVAEALAEGVPVEPEDVRDFALRAGHRAVRGPSSGRVRRQ